MSGLVVISISFSSPEGPEGERIPSNCSLFWGGLKKETSVPTGAEDMAICWQASRSFPGASASFISIFASERTMDVRDGDDLLDAHFKRWQSLGIVRGNHWTCSNQRIAVPAYEYLRWRHAFYAIFDIG